MLRVVYWITWLALSATAFAQPAPTPTQSEADRLFEEGRALAKDKKWAEACEKFTKSFELDPTVGTELNLADCHENLGHLRKAWELFVTAGEESSHTTETKRTKFARDRADGIATRMTTVIVKVAQPTVVGLAITIAGRTVLPAAEIRDHAEPGEIEVIATVPDHPHFAKSVTGVGGDTIVVEIPSFDIVKKPDEVVQQRDRSRVHLAWGLAGGSGASALLATIFTLTGKSHYNTTADGPNCMHVSGGIICNNTGDQQIKDAQRLADFGTVFALTCGALGAASAIVYFTAPTESVVLTPTATTQSVGVAISGRF